MIIDYLDQAKKYYGLHPYFAKAFEYLASIDLDAIERGKYEIDGESLRAIVSDSTGMKTEASLAKFECHDRHIDIQVCIKGQEQMGWKPRGTCNTPKGADNPEKDVRYYDDAPDMYFGLTDRQFAIFFPEDVHAPMIGDGRIKKIVIKVKI